MTEQQLLARVRVDPQFCSGRPHISGTGIYIAIILDALMQGLTPEEIVYHYPVLETDDICAAVAYAIRLAQANAGVAFVGRKHDNFKQLG